MELKPYIAALVRWSWLVILATVLAAGLSYRSASRVPRVYQATTTLLVGRTLQLTNPNPGDIETSQTLARSYVQLVKSQVILQATVDALHLNVPWYYLSREVNATVLSGTETIQIGIVDQNPQFAMNVANEIARQLILQSPTPKQTDPQRVFANEEMQKLQIQIRATQAQIADLQKRADQETSAQALQDERNQINILQQRLDGWRNTYAKLSDFYQGSHTNYLSVIQPAVLPTAPVGTSTKYDVALSAGLGFVLALGGVVLIEFLDDTIKSEKELVGALGLRVLGGIGVVKHVRKPEDQLFAQVAPTSRAAESFRFLATNVRAIVAETGAVLLVTSPGPADGKSTVAANLAVTLAHLGRRVILVDANLRRPSLHRMFDLSNREGLSTLLADGSMEIGELLRSTGVPRLHLLSSGPLPANPGDLVGSSLMRERLAELRSRADVVIVDSPAVLGAADSGMIASICDKVLLVVCARRTRSSMARLARQSLDQLGVTINGVVLNRFELGRRSYQSYYEVSTTPSQAPVLAQCPLLGLRADRSTVVLAASARHVCYSAMPAAKVDLARQASFCLTGRHATCPRFVAREAADATQPANFPGSSNAARLGES